MLKSILIGIHTYKLKINMNNLIVLMCNIKSISNGFADHIE